MLAGRAAFPGATVSDTIAAILEREPEWSALPSATPESVRHLLRRCLEKDARQRLRDIGEARIELLGALKGLEPVRPAQGSRAVRIRSRFAMWVALPLMLAAAGYFAWQVSRGMNHDEPLRAVSLTTLPGVERHPSFSPDGDRVAFSWNGPKQDNRDVYVQQVGSGSPLRLTTDPLEDQMPVWSPDGRWIAFVRSSPAKTVGGPSQTELRLVPPLGGPEKKLAEIQMRGTHTDATYLAWCPESDCLLVTDSPGIEKPDALFVVSLETGEKRQLTNPQPPVFGDASPAVSPDGSALLFLRDVAVYAKEAYWLPIGKGMTAGGEPRRIPVEGMKPAFPAWTPDGKDMLFSANGNLWRLSVSRGGRPARLPFVGQEGIMPAVSRAQNGRAPRLVYVRSQTDMNLWRIETPAPGVAAIFPPSVVISSTQLDNNPQFSPDGRRVAFCSNRAGTLEIWLADPDGSNAIQLTSMGAPVSCAPRWSPDGQWIAFDSDREGQQEINVIAVTGGKYRRITSHPASDLVPSFSRNSQWIYFGSNRSGKMQIWKVPASGGEPIQVTTNGGNAAFESFDGTQLYFLILNSGLWRMPVSGGPPVKILDGVVWLAYTVIEKGIYYIDNVSGESRLQFYDFASAKSAVVARNLGDLFLGLTASPDGRTILYTRVDLSIDDLMLVENFR
jgi:Tol biopolymer transport system component